VKQFKKVPPPYLIAMQSFDHTESSGYGRYDDTDDRDGSIIKITIA
jgi:hypothetical protein